MAISDKYGEVEIPHIGKDEPVFILRAQDRLAGPAIAMYEALARSHGASVAQGTARAIERFQQWRGPKKLPD